MCEFTCKKGCCRRTFCPLVIAYARTIHKFQGLTAGPVDIGKIQNMYDVLVCDPDDKQFEGSALGLLYTAVSRATTLGDPNGLNSAIYFHGSAFKASRIRNLTHKEDGKEFELSKKRRYWVEHINRCAAQTKRRYKGVLTQRDTILQWASTTQFTYDHVYHRINMYKNTLRQHD